jgi:hypothetical protein
MTPQTPQSEKLLDPVQIALEVVALRGDQASLTLQLNTAIQNMGGTLQALQGDMRNVRDGQSEITNQLHQVREHSTGLERLGQAIRESTEQAMRWRKEHEISDAGVRDRVNRMLGIGIGVGAVFMLLVTLGAAYINNEFNRAAEERTALKSDLKDVQRKLGIVP